MCMEENGTCLQVSVNAVEYNARQIVGAMDVPVIGVVKLDGYGLGLEATARAWQNAGVTLFGVSAPEEAAALRQAGFREDILLMAPVTDPETAAELTEMGVILTVGSLENARMYAALGKDPVRVHVKVDTGMGRFGVRWEDANQLLEIYRVPGLKFSGIFSHFSKAFETKYRLSRQQLERFLSAVGFLEGEGIRVGLRHMASSCAALRFPQTHLDAVRIGSALTGRLPVTTGLPLRDACRCMARVVDRRQLQKGDTVSYAAMCRMRKNTQVIVVQIGHQYGFGMTDGPDAYRSREFAAYLCRLTHRWLRKPGVRWEGQWLPLVGRVGSQYTLFDASDADVWPGELVTVPISPLQFAGYRKYVE